MIGGFTGIMLGTLTPNIQVHDTYYVVAHFHYVMVGGMVTALLGGVHYWWPKITGKMYNETLGRIGCLLIFLGFHVTFLPQFIMGSLGMPRRYFNYLDQFQTYHVLSTIGSYVLGGAVLMIVIYLIYSLFRGKDAPPNPWGSRGLEWQTQSPPVLHNFDHTPVIIHGPYDYHKPMEEFQLGIPDVHNGHNGQPVAQPLGAPQPDTDGYGRKER